MNTEEVSWQGNFREIPDHEKAGCKAVTMAVTYPQRTGSRPRPRRRKPGGRTFVHVFSIYIYIFHCGKFDLVCSTLGALGSSFVKISHVGHPGQTLETYFSYFWLLRILFDWTWFN